MSVMAIEVLRKLVKCCQKVPRQNYKIDTHRPSHAVASDQRVETLIPIAIRSQIALSWYDRSEEILNSLAPNHTANA